MPPVSLLFFSLLHSHALLLHFFHPYPHRDSVPLLHCQPFQASCTVLAVVYATQQERQCSPVNPSLLQSSTCQIGETHKHLLRTGHLFDSLNPFTNCTVVNFSTVPVRSDGGDRCEVDTGELATAHWQMPYLSPHFSEASHKAKMLVSLGASLLQRECGRFPTFPL